MPNVYHVSATRAVLVQVIGELMKRFPKEFEPIDGWVDNWHFDCAKFIQVHLEIHRLGDVLRQNIRRTYFDALDEHIVVGHSIKRQSSPNKGRLLLKLG